MPGPWYTSLELQEAFRARLRVDALDADQIEMCDDAVTAAYRDLANILSEKGYTLAQLDLWDDRVSYSKDQALFWVYTNAGLIQNQPGVANPLDHRKELRESGAIRINGKMVAPGADSPAVGVAVGQLVQDAGGVNYGSLFGLRRNRGNGVNQYGDLLKPGESPPRSA